MTSRPKGLILFVLVLTVVPGEAFPKRSGSFGGRSRSGGTGGRSKGTTLKKAAVISAMTYSAYQLGKLSGRFSGYHGGYSFNVWNGWRKADGCLCRNS